MFALVRDKIAVESVGCLNYLFTPDWKPLPDHDSFGHDVETAYLLTEASAVLGRPEDARTWRLARRIVDHALDFGWDADNGGFYDSGAVFGSTPYTTDKIWWVQAEGLNALLLMHARYGQEDAALLGGVQPAVGLHPDAQSTQCTAAGTRPSRAKGRPCPATSRATAGRKRTTRAAPC